MATAPGRSLQTPELDREIAEAEAAAIVVWRGEQLRFASLRERIAATADRAERDALFESYREALEALNPRYERRFAAWRDAGDVVELASRSGPDPRRLATEVERFVLVSETPYYAALRRYLALLDIEQGDATVADLWHVVRGTAWTHWFGERSLPRAVEAAGRAAGGRDGLDGWRAAERMLAGAEAGAIGESVVARAYASLTGSPEWLAQELGVVEDEIVPLVDFVAFVRLWRLRREIGRVQYELRLFAGPADDPAISRAYYGGILGHITGVLVPEEAYLRDVPAPFDSARRVQETLLAGQLLELLEQRHGPTWWREPDAAELTGRVAAAGHAEDVLAQLGYDEPDWRPVLRQIRTRLIGEMSGYGGPNITTRAGTRKV